MREDIGTRRRTSRRGMWRGSKVAQELPVEGVQAHRPNSVAALRMISRSVKVKNTIADEHAVGEGQGTEGGHVVREGGDGHQFIRGDCGGDVNAGRGI